MHSRNATSVPAAKALATSACFSVLPKEKPALPAHMRTPSRPATRHPPTTITACLMRTAFDAALFSSSAFISGATSDCTYALSGASASPSSGLSFSSFSMTNDVWLCTTFFSTRAPIVTNTVRIAALANRTERIRPETDSAFIYFKGVRNKTMEPAYAVDCLLHVTMLFTVLSLFFQFFISKTTTNAFKSEFGHLVNQNVESNAHIKKAMSSVIGKDIVKTKNWHALHDLYSQEDDFVKANNNWLFRASLLASAGLTAVILAITWASGGQVPLGSLLRNNLITFALVGVVEYIFFTRVAMRFQPAPPSLLITSAMAKAKRMFS